MLTIKPRQLRLIRRLARVRRPPTPFDGHLSPRGHHRLEHVGGGSLIFHTNDNRISVTSQLQTSGDDATWIRLLEPQKLHYLRHLEEGGSLSLSVASHRCLSLRKNFLGDPPTPTFRFPLYCFRSDAPSPLVDMDTAAVNWQPIDFGLLKRSLQLITRPHDSEHHPGPLNTISFLQDARAVGYHKRVHLQFRCVPTPFPVHLNSSDATRLLAWLRIVALDAEELAEESNAATYDHPGIGEVGSCESDGQHFYLFRTQCRRHTVRVISSLDPCPTGFQDRANNSATPLYWTMEREGIRSAARCLQVFRDGKIELQGNPHIGDRLDLALVKEEGHTSLGYLSTVSDGTRAQPPEFRFQCSPRDLFTAVSLHKSKIITFRFLSDHAFLVLESRDKPVGANPAPVFETVIRVRPMATRAGRQDNAEEIVREALTTGT
jgi:hypothetical protein